MQRPERSYSVRPYRFLVDRSVAKAGSLMPASAGRVLHLRDIGLPENAADSAIVESAADEQTIIATANGRDFVRAIEAFQKRQMWADCHDLYGLLILPNHYANQERFLPKLTDKLGFEGSPITWRHVQINNLSVRLTDDGKVKVAPLARCRYCLEFDPKRPMKKD
jgi:hypothetical protein